MRMRGERKRIRERERDALFGAVSSRTSGLLTPPGVS